MADNDKLDASVVSSDGEWNDTRMCNTHGIWLRKNVATNELEIWYNGVNEVTWENAEMILPRLSALLREAFSLGERETKRKLREFIGAKG